MLPFCCNSGYTNAPQYYVISTTHVLAYWNIIQNDSTALACKSAWICLRVVGKDAYCNRERGQSERRLWPTASGHAWRKIVFSCSQPRIYSTRTLLSRSPKAYRVHTRLSSRWLWLIQGQQFFYIVYKKGLFFHCFTVHFDSLSFIHTNSCTFSYNYVSVF